MYQTPVTIEQTLDEIERNEIVLPAIQREFVWRPQQICELFDSLMQGYPFGTFLYWKVRQENNHDYQFYGFVQDYHQRNAPHCPRIGALPNRDVVAVLDGQQRLTALNIGLRGSMATKLPRKRWDNPDAFPTQMLYLDLMWHRADEDDVGVQYRFQFLPPEDAEKPNPNQCWFPVKDILKLKDSGPAMQQWLEKRLPNQSVTKSFEALHKLYQVVREKTVVCFYEEPRQDLEQVLQIFIRTNSGGTTLSYSDLLLSVAVAQWSNHDAREEIHKTVDDLNSIGDGFKLSKDWVLKAGLMLSNIGSVGFKVENFNRKNMKTLERHWRKIQTALKLTVSLVSDFGFRGETLPADSALLPIAYYLCRREPGSSYLRNRGLREDREEIRRWLLMSLLKSGIWGSGLDTLLTEIRAVIIRESRDAFPAQAIREAMRARGKSLVFDDEEIDALTELTYGDRLTFPVLSLIFNHPDRRSRLHIDHIFPKSRFSRQRLKAKFKDLSDDAIDELAELADMLPNLQLLDEHSNVEKQDKLPAEWLATLDQHMRSEYKRLHLLGDVPEGMSGFRRFHGERRERLAKRIRELVE